ncbi:MAG: hypothetical protein ABI772_14190 [Bacteroidota bacterium]
MRKKIQSKIAHYLFHREFNMQERQQKLVSFDNARSIGLLYDSTNERNYDVIKKFVKELREVNKKDVLALGYYDKKELPNDRFAKLGLDFFTRKSLNWHYKPIAPIVKNFMAKDFDILIDLHTSNSIIFRYIAASTKAKFKIGKYSRLAAPFYDFMISINEGVTLPQFIEQINHYLNLIRHEPAH